MLLAEVFSELRFTTPSPFECAVVFLTCETGSVTVYLFAVALEALLLRKRFMSGATSTQEVCTRASGRCPFFRLITSLRQINLPKQIGALITHKGLGTFIVWRRTTVASLIGAGL
jgi:hypothetical protein